jgi:hypothetical protein
VCIEDEGMPHHTQPFMKVCNHLPPYRLPSMPACSGHMYVSHPLSSPAFFLVNCSLRRWIVRHRRRCVGICCIGMETTVKTS